MGGSIGYPRPGAVIAGKYRVDRVLGVGGMGSVVAAEHLLLKQRVALKFVHDANDRDAKDRFIREARAAALLESEHVCRVMDVGVTDDGAPYIVMEMLAGMDLGARLVAFGPQSIEDSVDWVLQVLDGLSEAHARGIVHRDLKPSNLFLANRGDGSTVVKVLDFGISKLQHAPDIATAPTGEEMDSAPPSSRRAGLTATGVAMGSPPYMSPEQLQSARDVDARCDLWAVGAILYELLTGKRAFPPSTDLFVRILAGEHARPRALRSDIPDALEAVIERCLAVDRNDRWASAAHLATALEPFAPARAHGHAARARRWSASAGRPLPPPPSSAPSISGPGGAPTGGVELATTRLDDATKRARLFPLVSAIALAFVLVAAVAAVAIRQRHAPSAPVTTAPEPAPTPFPMSTVASSASSSSPPATITAPPSAAPSAALASPVDAGAKVAPRLRTRPKPSASGDVDLGRL